jgi:aspartate racemase
LKTIGIIGGMSWQSTLLYYRGLNEGVTARLGGLHSAQVLLDSLDFAPIAHLQHNGAWAQAGDLLAASAQRLQRGGAEGILIATNTMHVVAQQVQAVTNLPLLHIADATGVKLRSDGVRRVALLGTRFTMEQSFYRERLEERFGLDVLVPNAAERETIHRVIYDELCYGQVREASRAQFLSIIARLRAEGAEAVIEGCTEIVMLVQKEHTDVPLYDTTALHVAAAVDFMLSE